MVFGGICCVLECIPILLYYCGRKKKQKQKTCAVEVVGNEMPLGTIVGQCVYGVF